MKLTNRRGPRNESRGLGWCRKINSKGKIRRMDKAQELLMRQRTLTTNSDISRFKVPLARCKQGMFGWNVFDVWWQCVAILNGIVVKCAWGTPFTEQTRKFQLLTLVLWVWIYIRNAWWIIVDLSLWLFRSKDHVLCRSRRSGMFRHPKWMKIPVLHHTCYGCNSQMDMAHASLLLCTISLI